MRDNKVLIETINGSEFEYSIREFMRYSDLFVNRCNINFYDRNLAHTYKKICIGDITINQGFYFTLNCNNNPYLEELYIGKGIRILSCNSSNIKRLDIENSELRYVDLEYNRGNHLTIKAPHTLEHFVGDNTVHLENLGDLPLFKNGEFQLSLEEEHFND